MKCNVVDIREKIEIPITMAYLTLQGAGAGETIIRWDDTADRLGPNGDPLGTYGSATFAVNAPHFVAKNITFKVVVQFTNFSTSITLNLKLFCYY